MEKDAFEVFLCQTFTTFLLSAGSSLCPHVGQSPHLFLLLNKPQELDPMIKRTTRTATEYFDICST